MARVARNPVVIADGVDVQVNQQSVVAKGTQGTLNFTFNDAVEIRVEDGKVYFTPRAGAEGGDAQAGTARALVQNMVNGVSQGYKKELDLVGVGYRAKLEGRSLHLSLGLSHPVVYEAPEGISFQVPSQTEIVIEGIDKQKVGQVAAELRAYRPPEPYKGKGIRYKGEVISLKKVDKK